jgi:hypothetical protein
MVFELQARYRHNTRRTSQNNTYHRPFLSVVDRHMSMRVDVECQYAAEHIGGGHAMLKLLIT